MDDARPHALSGPRDVAAPAARRRSPALVTAALVALVMLVLLAAGPARAQAAGVDDWVHVWEVVQLVNAQPPAGPVVYYLGDSIGRESIVNDGAWTQQLQARAAAAGRRADVVAYTVSSHNQTFGMDRTIVGALPVPPAGQPQGIVLIGVGISRFIGPPTPQPPARVDPLPDVPPYLLSPWTQHHYDARRLLSVSRKRELVPRWMERRWAGFRRSLKANLAEIDKLIADCKARNLRPVIFELPLNLAVVGRGLDKPRAAYRSGCSELARTHGIKYLSLQPTLKLANKGFWDIHHLVRPGYRRWQAALTDELIRRKLIPAAPSL